MVLRALGLWSTPSRPVAGKPSSLNIITHTAPPASAVGAYKTGKLAFGFSAGGFLFSYHIGVANVLRTCGLLSRSTPLAGVSAGALVASLVKCGVDHEAMVAMYFEVVDELRRNGTAGRIRAVLEAAMERYLPLDAHLVCSGTLHVGVSQLLPYPRHLQVSHFPTRRALIDTLLTSCHLPRYSSPDWTVPSPVDGWPAIDGGFTCLVPSLPNASGLYTVKVCCLPQARVAVLPFLNKQQAMANVAIVPDHGDLLTHHDTKQRRGAHEERQLSAQQGPVNSIFPATSAPLDLEQHNQKAVTAEMSPLAGNGGSSSSSWYSVLSLPALSLKPRTGSPSTVADSQSLARCLSYTSCQTSPTSPVEHDSEHAEALNLSSVAMSQAQHVDFSNPNIPAHGQSDLQASLASVEDAIMISAEVGTPEQLAVTGSSTTAGLHVSGSKFIDHAQLAKDMVLWINYPAPDNAFYHRVIAKAEEDTHAWLHLTGLAAELQAAVSRS